MAAQRRGTTIRPLWESRALRGPCAQRVVGLTRSPAEKRLTRRKEIEDAKMDEQTKRNHELYSRPVRSVEEAEEVFADMEEIEIAEEMEWMTIEIQLNELDALLIQGKEYNPAKTRRKFWPLIKDAGVEGKNFNSTELAYYLHESWKEECGC